MSHLPQYEIAVQSRQKRGQMVSHLSQYEIAVQSRQKRGQMVSHLPQYGIAVQSRKKQSDAILSDLFSHFGKGDCLF